MSWQVMEHVWRISGVTSTQKLILIYLADNSCELGAPVEFNLSRLSDFACCDPSDALLIMQEMSEAGLIYWPQCGSSVYVAYDGTYFGEIDPNHTPKNREKRVKALIDRDGPCCKYCGAEFPYFHIDHVIPRSRGGADTLDNLVLACPPCNLSKGSLTPDEWKSAKGLTFADDSQREGES